jgi:hypothetical protein
VLDGTLKRLTFRQYMGIVRSMVREHRQAGTACGCAKTVGTCRELLAVEPALWTFVRVAGIEPTNNAAERALPRAVLWRKTSHGTDSETGSRFVETMWRLLLQGTPIKCRGDWREKYLAKTSLDHKRWLCCEIVVAAGTVVGLVTPAWSASTSPAPSTSWTTTASTCCPSSMSPGTGARIGEVGEW